MEIIKLYQLHAFGNTDQTRNLEFYSTKVYLSEEGASKTIPEFLDRNLAWGKENYSVSILELEVVED